MVFHINLSFIMFYCVCVNQCLYFYLFQYCAKYCDEYVCLFVCLFVWLSVRSHNSNTTWLNFTKFFTQVACRHGSVLLWQRCDMLSTSGFVDDVIFSYRGQWARIKHDVVFRRSSPGGGTGWTPDNCVWLSSSECSTGAKSAIYDCLVFKDDQLDGQ